VKRNLVLVAAPFLVAVGLGAVLAIGGSSNPAFGQTPTPIQHVVVFYQENHTFDNIFGAFCNSTTPPRCNGATTGTLSNGTKIALKGGPRQSG